MPADREIKHVALLDLTGATSTDLLDRVSRISNVAAILVPESLLGKLMAIPMSSVAATVPVPDGKRVRVMSGQIVLSGEALAGSESDADEILVVAGQLVITSPVQQAVRHQIMVIGQVLAPAGSETGLGTALTRMSGQVMYYPYTPGANVKVQSGSTRLSGAELANANGHASDILISVGQLVVTSPIEVLGYEHIVAIGHVIAPRAAEAILAGHVTSLGTGVLYYTAPPRIFEVKERFSGGFFELLKAKVHEIVFDGKLVAPRKLVPMLQILATQRGGRITTSDDDDD